MIQTKVFRKHYLVTALILIAFVALGMAANMAIFRVIERYAERTAERRLSPESSIARVIDAMAEALADPGQKLDRAVALRKIREANGEEFPLEIRLVDTSGHSFETPSLSVPESWDAAHLPTRPYEIHALGAVPQEPGPPAESVVLLPREKISVHADQAEYLYIRRKARPLHPGGVPGGPPIFGPFPAPALASLVTLLSSILAGAAVSLWLLFRSFRTKAALADQVIDELQSGNLKARFPIDRIDEMGQTMSRFNRMADEIERLVEKLRESERTRTNLLQELAHDLRTPVASLKSLLETLESKGPTLDPGLHTELSELALKEVDYFERLVEDLLVLARIGEPNYRYEREPFSLGDLVEEEIDSLLTRRAANGTKKVAVDFESPEIVSVVGDAHLLRRMIRNALENGFDFAKSKLEVRLQSDVGGIAKIEVLDDGPGFTNEQLSHFGTRRMTRQLGADRGGRISIGLGSVIMRTIAEIHRGKLVAANSPGGGGRVVFEIPSAAV